MASNTRILKRKRKNRIKNSGKRRKAKNNNKGVTPKFSIHPLQTQENHQ